MNKHIDSIQTEKCSLEVFECTTCGFHTGIDATYLEQIGDLDFECPNCKTRIRTEGSI